MSSRGERFLLALGLWLVGVSAQACEAEHSAAARTVSLASPEVDVAVLNTAFLQEINAHRCSRDLPPLRYQSALEKASQFHSDWMENSKSFAHESTLAGMENPSDRARHFGYDYRIVAENLASVGRFDFRDQPFYVEGPCQFVRQNGDPISAYTYAQLARTVGDIWMNSPSHRANILRDGLEEAATAIAIDLDAEHCGRVYVTMLYGTELQ